MPNKTTKTQGLILLQNTYGFKLESSLESYKQIRKSSARVLTKAIGVDLGEYKAQINNMNIILRLLLIGEELWLIPEDEIVCCKKIWNKVQ